MPLLFLGQPVHSNTKRFQNTMKQTHNQNQTTNHAFHIKQRIIKKTYIPVWSRYHPAHRGRTKSCLNELKKPSILLKAAKASSFYKFVNENRSDQVFSWYQLELNTDAAENRRCRFCRNNLLCWGKKEQLKYFVKLFLVPAQN